MSFFDALRLAIEIKKNKLDVKLSGDDFLKEETAQHSKSYSDLLKIYVRSVRANIIIKNLCKIFFFVGTMGALAAMIYFFYIALNYVFKSFDTLEDLNDVSIEAILGMVTILVPAISSLTVAFVKIPEVIAQYLFNSEEDNYMNLIIKNIQDYDTGVQERDYKIRTLLLSQKDKTEETKDEEIQDVPENIPSTQSISSEEETG